VNFATFRGDFLCGPQLSQIKPGKGKSSQTKPNQAKIIFPSTHLSGKAGKEKETLIPSPFMMIKESGTNLSENARKLP
jgi:hypothetical protein